MGTWILTTQLFNTLVCLKYSHNKMSKQQNHIWKKLGFEGKESSFEKRVVSIPPHPFVLRGVQELAKGSNKGKFSVRLHAPSPFSNQLQEKIGLVRFCFICPILQILIAFLTFW